MTIWDEYTERSTGRQYIASSVAMLATALRHADPIGSALEVGCGSGNNLAALDILFPGILLTGVDSNKKACEVARGISCSPTIINCGFMDCLNNDYFSLGYRQWDLTLSVGFLIHVKPEELQEAYRLLYRHSMRYILLVEYYSPKPVKIEYHGQMGLLWKRDFAGEMLDRWSKLRLLDYGFVYHRDKWRQDDVNWFLMERS